MSRPEIAALKLRTECCVIAESLHLHRYKFLWDILFERHPHGKFFEGKWQGLGEKKTDVPSDLILVEMFQKQPAVVILDEFQTWFEGLTNTKQYPFRNWAFNFIQILSEIAQRNPELLTLVVSVRDGNSDAYQQIHRVNPVLVDFQGPLAKRDRQRLLLHRIFENRLQVPAPKINGLIHHHVNEYFRLAKVPQPEQERRQDEFLEAWPFAPHLLKLLDDQVLIAADAQETRDLIKILVDLYKQVGEAQPIITAADFSLTNEKSGVASLLDSVANELHKDLRAKALKNLELLQEAVPDAAKALPHLDEIISALWLRSLTLDKIAGADPADLQIDITRSKPLDDNKFEAELATIEESSFNIHRVGTRLVFKHDENLRTKLLAHAKNDKLFPNGEDIDHLAKEIRSVISGPEHVSQGFRVVVLRQEVERATRGPSSRRRTNPRRGRLTASCRWSWCPNIPKARRDPRHLAQDAPSRRSEHDPLPAAAEGHRQNLLRQGTAGLGQGGLPCHAVEEGRAGLRRIAAEVPGRTDDQTEDPLRPLRPSRRVELCRARPSAGSRSEATGHRATRFPKPWTRSSSRTCSSPKSSRITS